MSGSPYINCDDGVADCRPAVYVYWDRQRGGLTIRLMHPVALRKAWGFTLWMPEAHAVMDDFGELVVVDGAGA